MKKEIEKKIRQTAKFMTSEFIVEIATNQFDFEKERKILAEDLSDYSDFDKKACKDIAKEVFTRLRTFANAIQTAQAAAIQ